MNELMPVFLKLPTRGGTKQYNFPDTLAIAVAFSTVSWGLTTRTGTGKTATSLEYGTKMMVFLMQKRHH